VFWSVAYLGVVLTGIKWLSERGFVALTKAHKHGDYGPIALTGGSILLLALTIHSFTNYFRHRDHSSGPD